MGTLRLEDLPHYTWDDYRLWEGRWELIHGVPYAMTPAPSIWHQQVSQNIAALLQDLGPSVLSFDFTRIWA
jgi:hypothetical protein